MNVTEKVARAVFDAAPPRAMHDGSDITWFEAVESPWRGHHTREVETARKQATAALAALSDPEVLAGMGEVLWEHRAYPAGSPHCKCGWRPALYLNDTESDRRQHHGHQATALADWLRGQR